MPRGSNTSAETDRIKASEKDDFADGKTGAGAKHNEIVGYRGPRKINKVKK